MVRLLGRYKSGFLRVYLLWSYYVRCLVSSPSFLTAQVFLPSSFYLVTVQINLPSLKSVELELSVSVRTSY